MINRSVSPFHAGRSHGKHKPNIHKLYARQRDAMLKKFSRIGRGLVAVLFFLSPLCGNALAQSPVASPTPFPGNTVVNVSPGNGSISAAVNANGGNTTYMLANGNYTDANINCGFNSMQFIGSGPANVTVTTSPGQTLFNNAGTSDFFQLWGMTLDCADSNDAAIAGNFSDFLFQNVHVQNYSSNILGQECFPVFLFATGYSPNNQLIDHCQFTPASSGNVDGTSVVATGAFRPDGSNYTNITISNNIFDTPTDHGTAYYHCLGSANLISGNTFVAPGGQTGPNFTNGQFWYSEPGSWNGSSVFQDNSSNTDIITGNTVTLTNSFDFFGVLCHPNGKSDSVIITGNTIHGSSTSGYVVNMLPYAGCDATGLSINAVTIQNNAIDAGVRLVNQGCSIGTLVDSPNNGATPFTPSANDAVVTTVGPTLTDTAGNVWAITSGGQVSLNGSTTATSYTAGVTEIAYVSGTIWQYTGNAGANWYSFNPDGTLASGPTTTSPLPNLPSTVL